MAAGFKVTQCVSDSNTGSPGRFFCHWSYVPLKAVIKCYTLLIILIIIISLPSKHHLNA